MYLHMFPRALFIEWHRSTGTDAARQLNEFVSDGLPKLIADYESRPRRELLSWDPLQPRRFKWQRSAAAIHQLDNEQNS